MIHEADIKNLNNLTNQWMYEYNRAKRYKNWLETITYDDPSEEADDKCKLDEAMTELAKIDNNLLKALKTVRRKDNVTWR